jgi:sec-independent protein translocase protein TatC
MFEDLKPHIKELRKRLAISVGAIFIGFFAFFAYWEVILAFITLPLTQSLPEGGKVIFTSVQEPFFTAIKVSFFSSFVVTIPIIFWQLWMFVSPGLYDNEKKLVIPFVFFASLMFFMGSAFSYYVVVPVGISFLINFGSTLFTALPSIGEYVGFFTKLILGFGVAFQLPVITFFLAKIGLVTDETLKGFFRYAVIIIFVLSALLTPPDLVTQFLMAVPMVTLYVLSIYIAKFINPAIPEDEKDIKETQE